MVAAIYARYSSDNQRVESIAAQLRYAREYCRQKGYSIIREYTDEAKTGTNDQRPGWQAMLADAEKGMFDILVMHKIDRAGRNEYDYYKNRQVLQRHGVLVAYAGMPFDTSTPEGRLLEAQMVGIGAYYSRNLSNEVKKGKRENAFEGKTTGSLAFGYTTDRDKYVVIDENTAPAVRFIFETYAAGGTYGEIKQWLAAKGFKTARGNAFSSVALHDLLTNPRYIGTAILGRCGKDDRGRRNCHRPIDETCLVVEDAHPAIIDKALYERVQNRMHKNRNKGGRNSAKHVYLLSGFVYCADCGAPMTGTTTQKGHSSYVKRYYRCSTKRKFAASACPSTAIPAGALEQLVFERLKELLLSERFKDDLFAYTKDAYQKIHSNAAAELDVLVPRSKKLRKAMNRIYELVEEGEAEPEDVKRLRAIQKDLREVETEIKEVEKKRTVSTPSDDMIHMFIEKHFVPYIKEKGTSDARALLSEFVDKIVVSRDTITLQYKFAYEWCVWERTPQGHILPDDVFPRDILEKYAG